MRPNPSGYFHDRDIDKTRPIITSYGQDIALPKGNGIQVQKSYSIVLPKESVKPYNAKDYKIAHYLDNEWDNLLDLTNERDFENLKVFVEEKGIKPPDESTLKELHMYLSNYKPTKEDYQEFAKKIHEERKIIKRGDDPYDVLDFNSIHDYINKVFLAKYINKAIVDSKKSHEVRGFVKNYRVVPNESPKRTLYGETKYQYLGDIVKIDTPTNAKGSVELLKEEFKNSKTRAKKRRIIWSTNEARSRANVASTNMNYSKEQRDEAKQVEGIYSKALEGMRLS